MDFFALKNITTKDDYKVTGTKYETSIARSIIKGESLKDVDLGDIYITIKKGKIIPDFMYNQVGLPIVSERLKDLLLDYFVDANEYFEFWKISTTIDKQVNYYIFNVIENIDCLNFDDSSIEFYEGTTVIKKAENISLFSDKIGDRSIIRVNEIPTHHFINDKNYELLSSHKLNGLKLEPLKDFVFGF
jgi:hypothetical protein